ncbi:DUF6705 family protein [Chryseobacterium zhengzhouense]|uniref:DUF6705 family protein n=1 Tax=Chryseobacterium zhengzhouense TaxID=1636086 RepID=A0ABW2LZJ2_9FLAO
MKTVLKIASVFMLLLYSVNAYSQNHVPQAGDTIPNPNLEKYAGTWKWENNGKSFTLILKKMSGLFPMNINMSGDMLIGYHEYKNNGNIIESSLPYINDQLSNGSYSAFAAFKSSTPSTNELVIGITHLSKRKSIEAKIEYLDPTHIKIVSFSNYQGIKINTPTYTYDPAISFPDNIILTKQ